MADKGGTYGITSVTLAPPQAGGFPGTWTGDGTFSFKAIVRDSVSFNDAAPSDTDLYVEDTDDIYATLSGDEGSKGFTLDTYDLSSESYTGLMGFTASSDTNPWYQEPTTIAPLIKAVQIVTRDYTDFPSKTFEWAKMKITVTKAGTIGKSGFPNFHLEFKQLANINPSTGAAACGHRWKRTTAASNSSSSSQTPT